MHSIRPKGITALAVLTILAGLGTIFISIVTKALGGFIYGSFLIITSYGYWTGWRWAWWIGIVISFINIYLALQGILGLASSISSSLDRRLAPPLWISLYLLAGLIYPIINGLIIYYLARNNVRQFFGWKIIFQISTKDKTLPEA